MKLLFDLLKNKGSIDDIMDIYSNSSISIKRMIYYFSSYNYKDLFEILSPDFKDDIAKYENIDLILLISNGEFIDFEKIGRSRYFFVNKIFNYPTLSVESTEKVGVVVAHILYNSEIKEILISDEQFYITRYDNREIYI